MNSRVMSSKNIEEATGSYDEVILEQLFQGRQQKCTFFAGEIEIFGEKRSLQVLSIFHLSKWPYEDYRKGILWLKSKMNRSEKLN